MKKKVIIFMLVALLVISIIASIVLTVISKSIIDSTEKVLTTAINSKSFKDGMVEFKKKLFEHKKNNDKTLNTKNNVKFNAKAKDKDNSYSYNAKGKRDPFVRYQDSIIDEKSHKKLTPLEQTDISKLKLTAIISSDNTPRAVIEDEAGKGYFVEKGAYVGLNDGIITEILKDKLIITETHIDFTGKKNVRNIEMSLRK